MATKKNTKPSKPKGRAVPAVQSETSGPPAAGECIGGPLPAQPGDTPLTAPPLAHDLAYAPDAPAAPRIAVVTVTLGESRRVDVERLTASCEAQGVSVCVQHEAAPRPWSIRLQQAIDACIRTHNPDILVFIGDDAEMLPGCFEAVTKAFAERFPDFDGVVGINQTNIPPIPDCTEFGFVAVGRTFLARFGEHSLYCPDYFHFYADTELGLAAKALGKFYWAADAKAVHHHRGVMNLPKDETYRLARRDKASDQAAWKERQRRGLLWGIRFDRVKG